MRRARLTSILTLLCVPVLLAAAALVPLAVMKQTDRTRLETVHSLPAPADIGAPDAQAMEIPLVAQLYQLLLVQDADAYSPYVANGDAPARACTDQDVLDTFAVLRPALPADWAVLADVMAAQADDTQATGTELSAGFSAIELQFCREDALEDDASSFGTLTAVTAPDGVTPVQMSLYLNVYAMPRPEEFSRPQEPADPYGTLERTARQLGLDGLDWQPAALNASDGYWCIASDQANLRLVLHIQNRTGTGAYLLDITLTMVPEGEDPIL